MIDITDFLRKSSFLPILDVRTPDEYNRGRIPGSINLPLFSNEERKILGILYKQKGRDPAILKGLEFAGKKLKDYVSRAKDISKNHSTLVHCWRGGLRSASIAWLLDTAGIRTYVLKGGYKSYRNYVLKYFQTSFNFLVIGGMTGSGKTELLQCLKAQNMQVVDLEAFAHHKGSAFGALGQAPQTTNEQFENNIFNQLYQYNTAETIWIEDESQNIGYNLIPKPLFNQILHANMIYLDVPVDKRIQRLVRDYSSFNTDFLKACIQKISKRLGGTRTDNALKALDKRRYHEVAESMLQHYDKTYAFSMTKRDSSKIFKVEINTTDMARISELVLKLSKDHISTFHPEVKR